MKNDMIGHAESGGFALQYVKRVLKNSDNFKIDPDDPNEEVDVSPLLRRGLGGFLL